MRRDILVRAARVAAIYAAMAGLWIVCSDRAVVWLFPDHAAHSLAQTVKGIAFVTVTAGVLFALFRRELLAHRRTIENEFLTQTWLKAMVEHTTDIFFFKDAAGRYLFLNRAAEAFTGRPAAEIIGKDDAALFPSGACEHMMRTDREILATGRVSTYEELLHDRQGGPRHLLTTKGPLHDATGRIIGTFGVVRDITARKRAEDELERISRQRQLALNAANMGWWHYDPVTKIAKYDERYREIFGVTGQERPNEEILKLLHPEDLPRVWAAVEAALDPVHPKPYAIEFRVNRADGTTRWVEAHGLATFAGDGGARHAISFVGTVLDVTERRQAEKTLALSEERLRAFCSALPDVALLLDEDGRFIEILTASDQLLYRSSASLMGRTIADVFPASQAATFMDVIRRTLESGEVQTIEYELQLDVGMTWFEGRAAPVKALDSGRRMVVFLARDITKRKQAEDQMAASEARLQRIFQDLPQVAIQGYGPDGTTQYWNRASELLYGYTAEEAVGRNLLDLIIPPEMRSAVTQAMLHMAETGQPVPAAELSLMRKDGTRVAVYSSHALVKSPGRPQELFCIDIDLTERKAAEAARRETESRLQMLGDNLPGGALYQLLSSPDGRSRFTYMSAGIEDIFGLKAEQILADPEAFWALLVAEDQPRVTAAREESARTLTVFDCEFRQRTVTGEVRWIHCRSTPRRLPDGATIWDGVVADITRRKEMEEELRGSVALLRSITDCSADMIFVKDRAGRFVFINPAGRRLTGLGPDALLGRTAVEMHGDAQEAARYMADDELVMRSGQPLTREETNTAADGTQRIMLTTKSPRIDSEGHVTGIIGVAHDMTALRKAERAVREKDELLHDVSAMAHIGGWMVDPATGRGSWTDEVARIFGVDPSVSPDVQFGLGFFVGESRARIEAALQAALADGTPYDLELQAETAAGRRIWVRTIGIPVLEDGRVVRLRGALQDITSRKLQAIELERTNRLYLALSQINQSVVRAQSAAGLFAIVCRELVDFGGFQFAWVGSVDHATKRMQVEASHGESKGYLDVLKSCEDHDPETQCPVYVAIREERRIVINEFTEQTMAGPWRERGLQSGFRAMAVFPLSFQNRVAGALTVYAGEAGFFQQREIELLDEAAADICFAWEKMHVAAEHARMEAQLQESERRYRLLADNAEDFVALSDTSGRHLYISPSYHRVTGWTPEEDGATDGNDRVHPDDLPVIRHAREANLAGEPTTIEHRVRCRDGAWLWVEACCKPIRGRDGRVEHLLLWSRDITRRKQAEEESMRLATIVEQASESIVITDLEGTIQYVNPAFERTSGYRRDEVIGGNPRFLKSGRQPASFYRQMWATLVRGEVWTGHLVNRRKDGALFEEESSITPIRDSSGRPVGFAAIKRDITEQVRLRAHNEKLHEQFVQAQRMESIGRLAGGVAHDFNNLLQAILGYTDILLGSTPANCPQRADLLEIQKTGLRAADLTRQLLAFGRKQNLDRRVVDVNTLITELNKVLHRVIGADIKLEYDCANDLERVSVDQGQIGQILLNLAINARDAMPRGGRLVFRTRMESLTAADLSAQPDVRPGRFVRISVIDTGTGMTPDVLARLFEPFFTTKDPSKGTGLGLATSYGIARQHGGWLDVQSEPGQGSCFNVHLPVVEKAELPAGLAERTGQAGRAPPAGKGQRILLVEDETTIRSMVQQQLERNGYRVISAADARDAHEQFERFDGKIDLVITDVVLPDVNGLELLDELLALKPDLHVLITSGYTDNEKRWPVIVDRKWPFIGKPYTFGELLAALDQILSGG